MSTLLKSARKHLNLTQKQAADRLGVSQPYFALLESGRRRLSQRLARRAVQRLQASPSVVPCTGKLGRAKASELPRQLSALGYPGFASVRAGWHRNPADVLLLVLSQEVLDSRTAEALPWVLLHYTDMDCGYLVREARLRNLSNRLGFAVSLALRVAERRNEQGSKAYEVLAALQDELRESRLACEDLFGYPMTEAEREWVRSNRSPDAEYWHVLSDWKPEHLQYANA